MACKINLSAGVAPGLVPVPSQPMHFSLVKLTLLEVVVNTLTQKRLKEVFHYDPLTGVFTRKCSLGCTKKGDIAISLDDRGYVRFSIDGHKYRAHRLSFLYMLGYSPENDIDHVNRIKNDNRWNNLRESSHQCNMRNTGNRSDNKTGVKGVRFDIHTGKWRSEIRIYGKTIHLGRRADFVEAVCLRLAAEQAENWSGCDISSPAYRYVMDNIHIKNKN